MLIRPLRTGLGTAVLIAFLGLASVPAARAAPIAPFSPSSVSDTGSGTTTAPGPALVERVRWHKPMRKYKQGGRNVCTRYRYGSRCTYHKN
jgi:hypothetical protein